MNCNVGGLDRILRIAVGLMLILLAATGTIGLWGYIGIIPLFTGVFRFCPVYAPFGMSTCEVKTTDKT
ncbi:MAG: DUF2892 domain-containing protein [Thiomicrospira sp.]